MHPARAAAVQSEAMATMTATLPHLTDRIGRVEVALELMAERLGRIESILAPVAGLEVTFTRAAESLRTALEAIGSFDGRLARIGVAIEELTGTAPAAAPGAGPAEAPDGASRPRPDRRR